MGRKIPGKKHRGVKDPDKQRLVRLQGLKAKINAPPVNPDVQEIPRTAQHIAKLKEQMRHPPPPKRRKKVDPLFQQNKNESNKQYLHRVHKACEQVMQEKAFENKYGVNIKRNSATGEVKLVKKPKDEIDEMFKKSRKIKTKNKKSPKKQPDKPIQSKSQKRQLKLKEKKQNKAKSNIAEVKHDFVKLGEVAHAPPTLITPRKVKTLTETRRPGGKNLLLKTTVLKKHKSTTVLFKNKNIPKATTTAKLNSVIVKIDKTAKRKKLPQAMRRRLEQQQSEVIHAYRDLKKLKKL